MSNVDISQAPVRQITDAQRDTIVTQIGRGNIMAICGLPSRIKPLADGIEMPVANGYKVRVRLSGDLYTVQRVLARGSKEYDKGTIEMVYAEQVGDLAYRASCYLDDFAGEAGE